MNRDNKNRFVKGSTPWNKGTKGIMKPNSGSFKKGIKSWITGKHHTQESKTKISEARKGKYNDENNPSWKGGCSEYYHLKARKIIKKLTGIGTKGRQINIHHIDGDFKNNSPNNLLVCSHAYHMTLHRKMREATHGAE